MRIFQIISGDLWAGAEVMYYNLLKGLIKINNIQLSAILLNEGKLSEEVKKLGIHVEIVDETRLNIFQMIKKIRNITQELSPDIIHSHRLKENILAYYANNSDHKTISLISTQHGMPEPLSKKIKYIKNMALSKYNINILSKHFRYVVAVSGDIRSNFIALYGIPESKIVVIHNGIHQCECNPTKKEKNVVVVVSAGRLFPIKDYTLMVQIAKEVLSKTDKVRFELAGDGPERDKILHLIDGYNLRQGFVLRGFIDDIESFYHGLDIYINTSQHEGFPMSLLEAMACGLPIIAPNVGGIMEMIVDGQEGFLLDGRNPKDYSYKCLELIMNKELIRRMGAASKEKINNEYSMDCMANNYYQLYNDVMNH